MIDATVKQVSSRRDPLAMSPAGLLNGPVTNPLGLFDLDDRLALIRSAIQAGVMRQLDLVALRTDGHTRRCDAQFLCAPLVASFP
jgi:hypothetical protein